jgi:hypothetical protein
MTLNLTGLGAATCPSAEQLQGVVDLNDPCQQSQFNAVESAQQSANSVLLNQLAQPDYNPALYIGPAPTSGISGTTILIFVGLGLLFMMGKK